VQCIPTFAGERTSILQRAGATFDHVTLATTREAMLGSIIRGLVEDSARSYTMLAKIRPPQKVVYAMGGAGKLQHAMHRAWPKRHLLRQLEGDSLRGLVELARRAID
jgi:sugar (pentulose or hexulose) kinase